MDFQAFSSCPLRQQNINQNSQIYEPSCLVLFSSSLPALNNKNQSLLTVLLIKTITIIKSDLDVEEGDKICRKLSVNSEKTHVNNVQYKKLYLLLSDGSVLQLDCRVIIKKVMSKPAQDNILS